MLVCNSVYIDCNNDDDNDNEDEMEMTLKRAGGEII